ncbi:AmmeMemoRadiSam system radical SAM enzyme [Tissierella sp. P1]|jgi:pyruvate formate lyase activating enzyme|uniref:AmmeMemoRadiSam system radical SAM enzyme n=1 Tax=Tissierella sp. P1 TaxID=1280483 RepID=UPI000BA13698|nr:AmmeMemoRadiSam system radical SAM enzyme [Tissierella sp. P1]OZV12599.1 AmmeMemoRadiSam system radical SAM enzyme [Tissierella sp. P1]
MKEAKHYKKGDNKDVYCVLCPHYCKIRDGNAGKCKVRKNIDGTLYTLNYGKVTSYSYDPIEKKPLYHFYPGTSIFSVGSFGCNLGCDFCQNWEIVYEESLMMDISEDDIITLSKAKDSIGIAYTYNEPSIWFEYVLDISKKIKEESFKNVMVTNGYINEEPLRELLPYVDAMNIDLKSIEDSFYKSICKGSIDPVIRTIEIASKDVHVEVTTMLIDGENASFDEIRRLAQRIAEVDPSIPLHLSRYFPAYKMKLPSTNIETLIQAKNIAKKFLDYVYIGNVWGVDNNSYCPKCYNKLVDRHLNGEIVGVENGKCKKCQYTLNFKY